ncbi:MAG: heterodisulfide reductase [Sulfurospirillaceae bacterium]|nr:heterodisulfide reductase [Sulfurospirillaceae bacterium]
MKSYILFDALINPDKTSSFVASAKELIRFFNIDAISIKGLKADVGNELQGVNAKAFYLRNAYNLALASKEGRDILCIENSSYNSLSITKEALLANETLKNEISQKLETLNLKLSLDVAIFTLEEILRDDIGFSNILGKIKHPFSDFRVALFQGTSTCRAEKYTDTSIAESLLTLLRTDLVHFECAYESDGYEVLDANPLLAKKLAGKAMLDMFDTASDFIIAKDARSFMMFDTHQKDIEKVVGREIGLATLTLPQVLLMGLGVTDQKTLGLNTHTIRATLI